MAFLRPWFHKLIQDDLEEATSTVCELAFMVAQWPGQWWARDHGELWDIIRTMARVLGEELREKHRGQAVAEVRRLEDIVVKLEGVVMSYEKRAQIDFSPSRQMDEEMGIPPPPAARVLASQSSSTHNERARSVLTAASCFATGFVFGAFVTLCIFSSQRRTLATHLT
jgi:hypothetical protein